MEKQAWMSQMYLLLESLVIFQPAMGRAHRIRVFLTQGSLFKCILLFLKLRVLKVPLVVIAHMDWMAKKMERWSNSLSFAA